MSIENDDTVSRLLRLSAPRIHAAADVEARVRSAFLDECREARRRIVRRRAIATIGVVAAVAAAVIVVRLTSPRVAAPARPTVAVVERLDGDAGWWRRADDTARTAMLQVTDDLRMDEWIETGVAARVGIRTTSGVSIRLDQQSKVRLTSGTSIDVAAGGVYVDRRGNASPLNVSTPLGIVRDIGTQFEVRVTASSLRIRVRSGIIELHRGGEMSQARAGTELTATQAGIASATIEPFGPEWEWMTRVAPPFASEGRTLAAYLEYVSREQGWTLAYENSALQREAQRIVVYGSVDGLPPLDAVQVVLAASGFVHDVSEGELRVSRGPR